MKTFSEAVAVVSAKIPHKNGEPNPTELAAAQRKIGELVERMDGLNREMADSEFWCVLCTTLIGLAAAGVMPLESAFFTAFMNGVTIGMEMERSDDWAAGIDTKLSTKGS